MVRTATQPGRASLRLFHQHCVRSSASFSFASARYCHCMFSGRSGPSVHNGITWSTTYPGHGPRAAPFAGQGCPRWNSALADRLRSDFPVAAPSVGITNAYRTMRVRIDGVTLNAASSCRGFPAQPVSPPRPDPPAGPADPGPASSLRGDRTPVLLFCRPPFRPSFSAPASTALRPARGVVRL